MAEAILSVIATHQSKLPDLAITDGQMIFVQDKRKIALDLDGKRVFYNEIRELTTEASRSSLLAPVSGAYYFVVETAMLWTYRDGGWVRITTQPEDIVCIGVSLPDLGKAKTLYVDTANQNISVWDDSTGAYVVVADTTAEISAAEVSAMFNNGN